MESALQALVSDESALPTAARIRRYLPNIEAALNLGHTRKAIYEALVSDGLRCSYPVFLNALHRARKTTKHINKTADQAQEVQKTASTPPIRAPATAEKQIRGFDWSPPSPDKLV